MTGYSVYLEGSGFSKEFIQTCVHAVPGSSAVLQLFHLIPTPQGSFYVLNDIFRLNYG